MMKTKDNLLTALKLVASKNCAWIECFGSIKENLLDKNVANEFLALTYIAKEKTKETYDCIKDLKIEECLIPVAYFYVYSRCNNAQTVLDLIDSLPKEILSISQVKSLVNQYKLKVNELLFKSQQQKPAIINQKLAQLSEVNDERIDETLEVDFNKMYIELSTDPMFFSKPTESFGEIKSKKTLESNATEFNDAKLGLSIKDVTISKFAHNSKEFGTIFSKKIAEKLEIHNLQKFITAAKNGFCTKQLGENGIKCVGNGNLGDHKTHPHALKIGNDTELYSNKFVIDEGRLYMLFDCEKNHHAMSSLYNQSPNINELDPSKMLLGEFFVVADDIV